MKQELILAIKRAHTSTKRRKRMDKAKPKVAVWVDGHLEQQRKKTARALEKEESRAKPNGKRYMPALENQLDSSETYDSDSEDPIPEVVWSPKGPQGLQGQCNLNADQPPNSAKDLQNPSENEPDIRTLEMSTRITKKDAPVQTANASGSVIALAQSNEKEVTMAVKKRFFIEFRTSVQCSTLRWKHFSLSNLGSHGPVYRGSPTSTVSSSTISTSTVFQCYVLKTVLVEFLCTKNRTSGK